MIFRVLLPTGKSKLFRGEWGREESPLGWRVLVPTKEGGTTGIVIGTGNEETEQEIISFPDAAPLLGASQLNLVEELSSDYLIPRGALLFKLLPSVFLWHQEELVLPSGKKPIGLDKRSLEVIEYVKKRKGVKLKNLKNKYNPSLLKLLFEKGFLIKRKEWIVPKIEIKFYRLKVPLEIALKRIRNTEKKRLLVFLSGRTAVSEEELSEWGFRKRDINDLIKRGLVEVETEYAGSVKGIPLKQEIPVRRIRKERLILWGRFKRCLEEISAICERNLSKGKSTLIIFSDTGDLNEAVQLLRTEFGDRLLEIHSRIPPKKLVENWFYAQNVANVVVGSYIASLCPARDTGCVVLFNESSAGVKLRHVGGIDLRRLTYILSKKIGAELIFTTPAPTVSSYHLVRNKRMELEEHSGNSPRISIVRRSPDEILTQEVYRLINQSGGKKVLFLIPKQGYSYVYCPRCESVVQCPECGTFLTYSQKRAEIYCTNCRYRQSELMCPECEGEVEEIGFGIEKAVEVVERNFGLKENFHFSTYPDWHESYDLTVVMSADSMLSVPSYRAREDMFIYLLKALMITGETLVVQSIFPEEDIFEYLAKGQYKNFYERELEEREKELLPPFCRLMLIKSRRRDIEGYIVKTVSPYVKMSYNLREECYDFLVKFKDRRILQKVRQLSQKFRKDIIEVKVDPF